MAEVRNEGDTRDPRNDISWYSRYPELVAAAASFPYPNRPGMKIPVTPDYDSGGQTPTTRQGGTFTVPGVMVLDWLPFAGKSQLPTDPASVLGKEMYARVRAAYSGTLRADAPDYVIYVLALDSVFAYIAWLKRLYRALSAYNPANYVIPDGLLAAMGLTEADIQSLRTNKTQLWQLINELVHQSRKFTCPSTLDIMNRHYWMSDNVYLDDNSLNSQIYLFNLRGVYKYADLLVPLTENTAPGLKMLDMPWVRDAEGAVLTPSVLYEFGRNLIDALVAWDESYTINGYLQRAYEGVSGFVVSELDQNEVISPVYEPEVLVQIENSHALPLLGKQSTVYLEGLDIKQDPSTNAVISYGLVTTPTADIKSALEGALITIPDVTNAKVLFSIRSDNPTIADNVIASRLIVHPTKIDTGLHHVTGQSTPVGVTRIWFDSATEVPFAWYIIQKPEVDVTTLMSGRTARYYAQAIGTAASSEAGTYSSNTTVTSGLLRPLLEAESFDWHPKAVFIYSIAGAGNGSPTLFVGDVHNCTAISSADLENLHRICGFSEFNSFSMM